MATNVLRLSDVKARTGQSRSTIYHRIAEGTFPKQIPLGGMRSVGWLESEVTEWIEACRAERDAKAINDPAPDEGAPQPSEAWKERLRSRLRGGRL